MDGSRFKKSHYWPEITRSWNAERAIQCVRKKRLFWQTSYDGLWEWVTQWESWFFANTLMLLADVGNKMCWWLLFVTDMALLITNISWNSVTNMLKSSPTLSDQHTVIYCQPILYHCIDYAFPIYKTFLVEMYQVLIKKSSWTVHFMQKESKRHNFLWMKNCLSENILQWV